MYGRFKFCDKHKMSRSADFSNRAKRRICLARLNLNFEIYKSLGSAILPATALAAATAEFARYTSLVLSPMRPTKFRLVVLTQRSPTPKIPIYPPKHAPQVGLLTTAPASTKISHSPSFCAARAIFCVAGVMMRRVLRATLRPFKICAAIRRSESLPLVQLPIKT